jgi:2-succinyl-6-hydroxy-2,4-cyclohexadiene-1-carboxylate synthase
MGTGSQPSMWGELSGLQAPALAVAGELDEKYGGIAHRMAEAGPMINSAIVPGAGHNVHAETPRRYLEALRDFLISRGLLLRSLTIPIPLRILYIWITMIVLA